MAKNTISVAETDVARQNSESGRVMTLGQYLRKVPQEAWIADLAKRLYAKKTMTEGEWRRTFDALRNKEVKGV